MGERKGGEEEGWLGERSLLSLPLLTSCCQIIILLSLQAAGNGVLLSTRKAQQSWSASFCGTDWENGKRQEAHLHCGYRSLLNLARQNYSRRPL